MGPCSQIRQDLGLAAASLAPEEATCIESLEQALAETDSSDILGPPVMVALLMIASQVHLVPDTIPGLKIGESSAQTLLLELQVQNWQSFHDLSEVVQDDALLVAHVHHSTDNLLNDLQSRLLVAQMWSHGALPELLNQNIHKSIKDAWRIEELFEYDMVLIWSLLMNIVKQRQ